MSSGVSFYFPLFLRSCNVSSSSLRQKSTFHVVVVSVFVLQRHQNSQRNNWARLPNRALWRPTFPFARWPSGQSTRSCGVCRADQTSSTAHLASAPSQARCRRPSAFRLDRAWRGRAPARPIRRRTLQRVSQQPQSALPTPTRLHAQSQPGRLSPVEQQHGRRASAAPRAHNVGCVGQRVASSVFVASSKTEARRFEQERRPALRRVDLTQNSGFLVS